MIDSRCVYNHGCNSHMYPWPDENKFTYWKVVKLLHKNSSNIDKTFPELQKDVQNSFMRGDQLIKTTRTAKYDKYVSRVKRVFFSLSDGLYAVPVRYRVKGMFDTSKNCSLEGYLMAKVIKPNGSGEDMYESSKHASSFDMVANKYPFEKWSFLDGDYVVALPEWSWEEVTVINVQDSSDKKKLALLKQLKIDGCKSVCGGDAFNEISEFGSDFASHTDFIIICQPLDAFICMKRVDDEFAKDHNLPVPSEAPLGREDDSAEPAYLYTEIVCAKGQKQKRNRQALHDLGSLTGGMLMLHLATLFASIKGYPYILLSSLSYVIPFYSRIGYVGVNREWKFANRCKSMTANADIKADCDPSGGHWEFMDLSDVKNAQPIHKEALKYCRTHTHVPMDIEDSWKLDPARPKILKTDISGRYLVRTHSYFSMT